MAIKLAIIHFQPIELYPPAMNTITYLEDTLPPGTIDVYTSASARSLFTFKPAAPRTHIKRLAQLSSGRWMRLINYFTFFATSTLLLILKRPAVVLYFETISALPAIIYTRFFNKKAALMVHYHEYTSPEEYLNGMKLSNWFHKMETEDYPRYRWISQMIPERMELFLRDHPGVNRAITHLLPNFPPSSWSRERTGNLEYPLKVVYVGSLSMDTMYVKEFAEWVQSAEGKVNWDIYSFNLEPAVLEFLGKLRSPFIRFKNGAGYFDLPQVLGHYDIGVVLYKGTIPNYVYNAPNKLFEYLSASLDVWLPAVMKGSLPFCRTDVYPKVVALDFESLAGIDLDSLVSRKGLPYQAPGYYSENVLIRLKNEIEVYHKEYA